MEIYNLASSDDEAIEFLVASAKAKLWKHAYENVDEAKVQAITYEGGEYSSRVKDSFLQELEDAQNLVIPQGYSFKVKEYIDPKTALVHK